jgi:hypothetical protein
MQACPSAVSRLCGNQLRFSDHPHGGTQNKALACSECHAKNGRLASLTGFYMPGRDVNKVIQYLGWAVVFGSLAGVFIHGLGRYIARGRKES